MGSCGAVAKLPVDAAELPSCRAASGRARWRRRRALRARRNPGAPKRRVGFAFRNAGRTETAGVRAGGGVPEWSMVLRRRAAPSGRGRWGPLALLAFAFSLVAQAVVEATEEPAVVLGGEPALRRRSGCGPPGRSRRAHSNGDGCRCGHEFRFTSPAVLLSRNAAIKTNRPTPRFWNSFDISSTPGDRSLGGRPSRRRQEGVGGRTPAEMRQCGWGLRLGEAVDRHAVVGG